VPVISAFFPDVDDETRGIGKGEDAVTPDGLGVKHHPGQGGVALLRPHFLEEGVHDLDLGFHFGADQAILEFDINLARLVILGIGRDGMFFKSDGPAGVHGYPRVVFPGPMLDFFNTNQIGDKGWGTPAGEGKWCEDAALPGSAEGGTVETLTFFP